MQGRLFCCNGQSRRPREYLKELQINKTNPRNCLVCGGECTYNLQSVVDRSDRPRHIHL